MWKTVQTAIIALAVVAGFFWLGQSLRYLKDYERSVKVRGLDERIVKSDQAIWTIFFSISADTITEIAQQREATYRILNSFLTEQGFKPEEIEKRVGNLMDNRSMGVPMGVSSDVARKKPIFSSSSGVVVTTSNVNLVQDAAQKIDLLLQQNVMIENSNVQFTYNNLTVLKKSMIEKATNNAYETAQSFVKNRGAKIGDLKQITQGLMDIQDATSPYEYAKTDSIMKKVKIVVTVEYFLK